MCLRIGLVLSPRGGVLAKLLPIFRLGLGGPLGSGRQYMSWITLDDLVRIVDYAIRDEGLEGPVNAASPHPVTNREFVRTLGSVVGRPAFLAVPAFLLRAAAGMADELFLCRAAGHPAAPGGSRLRISRRGASAGVGAIARTPCGFVGYGCLARDDLRQDR